MKEAQELLIALRNFVKVAQRELDESPHATVHIPTVGDGGLNIHIANLAITPVLTVDNVAMAAGLTVDMVTEVARDKSLAAKDEVAKVKKGKGKK